MKKIVLLICSIILTIICAISIYYLTFSITGQFTRQIESQFSLTAERLGVEDGNRGISKYITDNIHPGMSQKEVESILRKIAPIKYLTPLKMSKYGANEMISCSTIELEIIENIFIRNANPTFVTCYIDGKLNKLMSIQGDGWVFVEIYE